MSQFITNTLLVKLLWTHNVSNICSRAVSFFLSLHNNSNCYENSRNPR
jgi:hypothetical protein